MTNTNIWENDSIQVVQIDGTEETYYNLLVKDYADNGDFHTEYFDSYDSLELALADYEANNYFKN